MKKTFLLFAAASLLAASCTKTPKDEFDILTFEGDYYDALIDSPEYGGALLYGDMEAMTGTDYQWYDEGVTGLASELCKDQNGAAIYWNGGEAISNYVNTTLEGCDYTRQLSVSKADEKGNGGYDGSENFCVHNGFLSEWSNVTGYIYFKEGTARVIDHLYITNTTFAISVTNSLAKETDWTKVVAIGYNADGSEAGRTEFYLTKDGKSISDWTKWDTSSLGAVAKVAFTIESSIVNEYGMAVPAYFAFDNVAVRR